MCRRWRCKLLAANALGVPKHWARIVTMNFTFPYAWSNPAMPQEKLALAVLERGLFGDVCKLTLQIGVPAVQAARKQLTPNRLRDTALERMLRNIEAGFAQA